MNRSPLPPSPRPATARRSPDRAVELEAVQLVDRQRLHGVAEDADVLEGEQLFGGYMCICRSGCQSVDVECGVGGSVTVSPSVSSLIRGPVRNKTSMQSNPLGLGWGRAETGSIKTPTQSNRI